MRAGQHEIDLLVRDLTMPGFGEFGLVFEEAFHLGAALKLAGGIAFYGLGDNTGDGLIADHQLAMLFGFLEPIPVGRRKAPEARFHPGLHLLEGLTAHLQAFQLALRGKDGLGKFVLGRFAKLVVQAFDLCAALTKGIPQVEMKARIAGEAFEIVKDHNIGFLGLRIDI